MVFKIFWREGREKPFLRPRKTEFYNKNKNIERMLQIFLENGKIVFKSKSWNFNINFQI